MKKLSKKSIIFLIIIFIIGLVTWGSFLLLGKKQTQQENEPKEEIIETNSQKDTAVNIINLESKSRIYAVVINNSPVAVKAQRGLDAAFVVYEFPVEGGLTRLMALYKDTPDITIGTIRSARHNFIDYALEWNAIFTHFGWSHYAEDDLKSMKIDNINGLTANAFWRENPLNLASEHTVYTSINKLKEYSKGKKYSQTTESSSVFSYNYTDTDLSQQNEVSHAKTIIIPSNDSLNTTYQYNQETKLYERYVNENAHMDFSSQIQYTAKNIIIQKMNTKMASDNYYWDLETIGEGDGYFITNGYAVPIRWSKSSRASMTKYTYLNGEEIVLSDGNTYVQLQSTKQKLTIEGDD